MYNDYNSNTKNNGVPQNWDDPTILVTDRYARVCVNTVHKCKNQAGCGGQLFPRLLSNNNLFAANCHISPRPHLSTLWHDRLSSLPTIHEYLSSTCVCVCVCVYMGTNRRILRRCYCYIASHCSSFPIVKRCDNNTPPLAPYKSLIINLWTMAILSRDGGGDKCYTLLVFLTIVVKSGKTYHDSPQRRLVTII